MNKEVFQANKLLLFGIIMTVFIGTVIAYFQTGIPVWVLPIIFMIGVIIIVSSVKTKIIVENGTLRHEKLSGAEEVDLEKVAQIMIREVETVVDQTSHHHKQSNTGSHVKIGHMSFSNNQQNTNQKRQVERMMYVVDYSGRTMLSFPANMVGFTQRIRFKEAIHATNPEIEVF